VTAPDWSDAMLADLARDYPADVHDDVADLIAGVRAVLALHAPDEDEYGAFCPTCLDDNGIGYVASCAPHPCATVRALNLDTNGA